MWGGFYEAYVLALLAAALPPLLHRLRRLPTGHTVDTGTRRLTASGFHAKACYKDVSDFVWEPTVRNRRLTEDEMAIQREFLKAAAAKAGLKNYTAGGSTPNAFAADDAGWA